MSSTRKRPPAKGKSEAGPRQPIFTPQNVGIALAVIIVVSVLVFWKGYIEKKNQEIDTLVGKIATQKQANTTYQRKAEKLLEAQEIKSIMDEKLDDVQVWFLKDQDDVREFFFYTLRDLFVRSNIDPRSVKLKVEYAFKLPWYAKGPIETIPDWIDPEEVASMFTFDYIPKQEGDTRPEEELTLGVPDDFIFPLHIEFEEISTTYEGLKRLIENMQKRFGRIFTVHCFKNDSGENAGMVRRSTKFQMDVTIYMMNPNGKATGDEPDGMPGAESC